MTVRIAEGKVYRVKNLFEGSFLHARGFPLVGKELVPEGGKKWFLLFPESEELKKAVAEFYANRSAERLLFESYRTLKDYLFDNQ